MKRSRIVRLSLRIPLCGVTIEWGVVWLAVIPTGLWAIATVYVAIMGAFFNQTETWAATALISVLVGFSLVAHALAHAMVARWTGGYAPSRVPLYPFGDAAQVWPAASSACREVLVALAGPVANLLLAGAGFLLWNAQLNPYLNVAMPFCALYNAGLAVLNLMPAFPFDGGRLMRAIVWGMLGRPAVTTRLGMGLGYASAAFLAGWAVLLIAEQARFSLQTGATSLGLVALILLALALHEPWSWGKSRSLPATEPSLCLARVLPAGMLLLILAVLPSGLVPTNAGLRAPGVAVSVEPMVEVPPEYRHASAGTFVLTSVLEQTPITAGEWLLGRISPAIEIVPPEQIVPPGTTLQEQAREGFRMLDQSETTAAVVGLRLAGFRVDAVGKGAVVMSVLPDSPGRGVLQRDDVIVGLDDVPIASTTGLIGQLARRQANDSVRLQIERAGGKVTLSVSLMAPARPGVPPRLGITVDNAGFDYALPFPVKIVPQKIVGGPSAGLMFTLTVYNAVAPADLTGGRKIAGTGTIDPDGSVGPIGGVEQKVVAAEIAGAEYFLAPHDNYAAARAVARQIKVVDVTTAEDAVAFLRALPSITK